MIEDICVVPEADRDVLYAVIRRTINGRTVRSVEEFESREIDKGNFDAEAFFVDAGGDVQQEPDRDGDGPLASRE